MTPGKKEESPNETGPNRQNRRGDGCAGDPGAASAGRAGSAAIASTDTAEGRAGARNTLAAANYNLRIASAFLCDPSDSTTCPAAARAANGESIEISGAGTLSAASKSVTAAGAFTVKNPNGYILTIGVWTATGLVSFESYGIVPGALLRD